MWSGLHPKADFGGSTGDVAKVPGAVIPFLAFFAAAFTHLRLWRDRTLPALRQRADFLSDAFYEELRRWTERATFHCDDRNGAYRSGQINRQHRNRHVFGSVVYHRFR